MIRRFLGLKQFRGGPDLEHSYNVRLNLAGTIVNISHPLGGDPLHCSFPLDNNGNHHIPIEKNGWFEKNTEQSLSHYYIDTESGAGWSYGKGVWPPVATGPLGSVSCNVWIKKSAKGCELSLRDLENLKKTIYLDYKNYLEDPVHGYNIKVQRKAYEWAYSPYRSEAQIEDLASRYIRSQSKRYPEELSVYSTPTHDWLFYTEDNKNTRHYCLPITKEYYLMIRFLHQDWLSGYRHYWQEHANKTEQKIMESIQLIFPDTYKAITSRHTSKFFHPGCGSIMTTTALL
ncbi:hypothetical protein [Oceanobacter mangrovi]|uniref:hypothetical protein n=1 Tax=Oceanobacter mangrovi TaxID=2862510 RepID=UPI001C8ECE91|nr:hypothetical protein [Oceanobacter mangrovi]